MKNKKQNQTDIPEGEEVPTELPTDGAPKKERATISHNPYYKIARYKSDRAKEVVKLNKLKTESETKIAAAVDKIKAIDAHLAEAEAEAAKESQLPLLE